MAAIDRAQWIADARALIDFIEATPDLPLNPLRGIEVSYHPLPNVKDDGRLMDAVDAVAELLGAPVTTPDMPGSHYETEIRFGSACYCAVAVLSAQYEEYQEIRRLGTAALAEQTARATGGAAR